MSSNKASELLFASFRSFSSLHADIEDISIWRRLKISFSSYHQKIAFRCQRSVFALIPFNFCDISITLHNKFRALFVDSLAVAVVIGDSMSLRRQSISSQHARQTNHCLSARAKTEIGPRRLYRVNMLALLYFK